MSSQRTLFTAYEYSGASDVDRHAPVQFELADAKLSYFPQFYEAAESTTLLATLIAETCWRQDKLRFGGKVIPIPRLQAWYGDRSYAYSGLHLAPLPWTPTLDAIRRTITATCGLEFNSVLLNYYRDGRDSVSWHSDDEPELGPDPSIASLSFGATRRFELKHRLSNERVKMQLEDGSLLLMGTGLQRYWQHQLPKDPRITIPRLNLTFRLIL